MNNDLSDVASAITGSLARDGQGGMTAVLPMANAGAVYSSDPDTGIHRTGANEQALFCGGIDRIKATPTGGEVNGDLNVTGVLTVGGAALLPVGLGPLPWSGTTAPAKWVLANGQTLLRASYPALWTFAQTEIAASNILYTNGNGTTTFTVPDMCGRIPAGADNIGGITRKNRLTSATITPDATQYGASGGAQVQTLLTANLPPYTPSGTNSSITVTPPGGTPFYPATNGTIGNIAAGGGGQTAPVTGSTWTGASNMTGAAPTFTGSAQGGSSTAFDKIQPTIITNYIIYAGA